jgi:tRNA threonylcarbamoyladenosine biosynthesis protein TsaB
MSKIVAKKPIILAIETSGRTGSAALAAADELIAEKIFSTPVRHSSEIFPAITNLLEDAGLGPQQIDHIYISVGPGSFTGLRIAVTFAKIMHLADNNIKIVAVDTLDCIASNATDFMCQQNTPVDKIAAILDAKRGRFFIAVYQRKPGRAAALATGDYPERENHNCWEKTLDGCLLTPEQFIEQFADPHQPIRLLGEGLVFYKKNFEADGIKFIDEQFWTPKASKIHLLGYQLAQAGQFSDPMSLRPKYLGTPDIKIKNPAF